MLPYFPKLIIHFEGIEDGLFQTSLFYHLYQGLLVDGLKIVQFKSLEECSDGCMGVLQVGLYAECELSYLIGNSEIHIFDFIIKSCRISLIRPESIAPKYSTLILIDKAQWVDFTHRSSVIQLLMSRSKRDKSRTDFLQTPLSNRNRLKQKQKISSDIKQKYIQQLEQRNRKLKYEIIKINQMLEEQKEKGAATKKEHKLIPLESSPDVIKKELENVYKQIKNYEREINSLETKQAEGVLTDKMARLQNIFKEKTAHLEKLKNEFSVLNKDSLDKAKKLKNNAGKEELENAMLKYSDDMKFLREKVRNAEEKEKRKMENAKKQYEYIKKLERELVENGVSMDELQQMKKNNIFNQIYDKLNSEEKQPEKQQKKQVKRQETYEEITEQRFNQIKNEIKLYKKLHVDYQKRIDVLEKEKSEQERKLGESKKVLQEKQGEIKKLQEQINQIKNKMRKHNIKANVTGQKLDSKQKALSIKSDSKQKPPTNKSKNTIQRIGNEHEQMNRIAQF